MDRRQVECEGNGFIVTNDDKVDHFVAQMYTCGLFEAKFMDNWEEKSDKLWGATYTHLKRQFNKESRKLKREKSQKHYESSAIFHENSPPTHPRNTPRAGNCHNNR